MPSVVFMGTPDFAAGVLRSLIDSEYEVTAVFTQPDRPKGRKGVLQMPPVKELALENGIPVYQPEKIRKEENVRILEQLKPDFIVVAAFGQIIPQSILVPECTCVAAAGLAGCGSDSVVHPGRRSGERRDDHADGCRPGYRRYDPEEGGCDPPGRNRRQPL